MTAGVPAPAGWDGDDRPDSAIWRLRGGVGRPCVNIYLDHARGPLKVDARTTLPPAPRRVTVDAQRYGGWFTDPAHLDVLANALHAAADWLRTPTQLEPDPQLSIYDALQEATSG